MAQGSTSRLDRFPCRVADRPFRRPSFADAIHVLTSPRTRMHSLSVYSQVVLSDTIGRRVFSFVVGPPSRGGPWCRSARGTYPKQDTIMGRELSGRMEKRGRVMVCPCWRGLAEDGT